METDRSAAERQSDVPIEGARADDAVSEYYLRFQTALLRRMRSRLDEADAEDIVQEIFIQALRDVGRYDPARSSPRTWLTRLGDQVLAKYHRSRERRLRAEGGRAQTQEHTTHLTPDERAEIRDLLEGLTPLNHRIIVARFLLGETVEEIATQTGLSVEAVRQRISRSLALLRNAAAGARPS